MCFAKTIEKVCNGSVKRDETMFSHIRQNYRANRFRIFAQKSTKISAKIIDCGDFPLIFFSNKGKKF
jgi:hypothetical protein